MQRKVFEIEQDRYTKAGGVVTALACSTVTHDEDDDDEEETSTSASAWGGEGQPTPRQSGVKQLLAGLANGHIEEYRFDTKRQGSNLQVFRSLKVSKRPIDQLCIVSSGSSKAVCALSGGHLWVVSSDRRGELRDGSTQVKLGSLKGVFYIARDLCNIGCRNLLALCRTSLAPGLPKKLKLVFLEVGFRTKSKGQVEPDLQVLHEQVVDSKEVISSSVQVTEAVWYGDSVLMRTDRNYVHFALSTQAAKEIFQHKKDESKYAVSAAAAFFGRERASSQDRAEVCAHQYMVPMVEKKLTLLLAEDIGTIIDMEGEPTGAIVQFPIEPMAIHAMCFPYLLAVFAKSVYVYDIRKDLRDAHVQAIPFSRYFLSPNKVDSVPVTSWTTTTSTKENQIFVMVGYNDMLLFLSQTPLEDQCKEMLKASKFHECLQIANTSQLPEYREYLTEHSCAEAGLRLLGSLNVARALGFLRQCGGFEPAQFFPFFPEYTEPWLGRVTLSQYWGMHPPLGDLGDLLQSPSLARPAETEREAKEGVVAFLLEVRESRGGRGLQAPDGVDTLLAHLLLDVDRVGTLETLARRANHVAISQVQDRFLKQGRVHALALLHEACGNHREAASLWVALCRGEVEERPAEGAFVTSRLEAAKTSSGGGAGAVLGDLIPLEVARVLGEAGPGSEAVSDFLPWLMEVAVDVSLGLLSDLGLGVQEIMGMVRTTTRARSHWRYLDFVVHSKESKDPAHHTDLALAMINLWKSAEAQREESQGGETSVPSIPPPVERESDVDLGFVRSHLESFLDKSDYYNTQAVLSALKGTPLWPEQVIVQGKIGNHKEALRILTFVVGDREGAVRYCESLGTQEGYLTLLDMLLNPDEGPPLYSDAVRLLSSKGASLNPQRVLEALSAAMPLPLAYETLARMLRERAHRKRSGQVVKGLARAHELSVAQERVLALSEHIEITAERACRVCNVRIGTKVFGLYPNGVLVCYRCMMRNGKDAHHVCPVTKRDFSKEHGTL